MLKSFFGNKKWFLWAYSGLFLLLFFLYIQTSLNVAINEWYKDFYDVLQKPKIAQNIATNENNASSQEEQIKQAEEKIANANFLNKISLYFYQNLLKIFFNTPSISGKDSYSIDDFYSLIIVFLK